MFFLGAPIWLIGPLALGFAWWRYGHVSAVKTELARLRAEGTPISLQELDDSYTIDPTRPDATAAWMDVVTRMKNSNFEQREFELTHPNGSMDAISRFEMSPVARDEFLAEFSELDAAINRALAVGTNVRWPYPMTDGPERDIDFALHIRRIASVLVLRFDAAMSHGDFDDAFIAIEKLMQVRQTLSREPAVVPQLTAIAVTGLSHGALEQMLRDPRIGPAHLDQIEQLLENRHGFQGLGFAINGERATALSMFHGEVPIDPVHQADWDRYLRLPITIGDERVMLDFFRDFERSIRFRPTSGMIGGLNGTQDGLRRRIRTEWNLPILSAMLLPALSMFGDVFARTEASEHLLRTGVAVERYRLQTGHLPESWEDFAGDLPDGIPSDPFGWHPSAPMGLRVVYDELGHWRAVQDKEYVDPPTGPGLIIYSVGRDRIDNHGTYDDTDQRGSDWLLFFPEEKTIRYRLAD